MSFVALILEAATAAKKPADPAVASALAALKALPEPRSRDEYRKRLDLEEAIAPFVVAEAAKIVARVEPAGPKGAPALIHFKSVIAPSPKAAGLSVSELPEADPAVIEAVKLSPAGQGVLVQPNNAYYRQNNFHDLPEDGKLSWSRSHSKSLSDFASVERYHGYFPFSNPSESTHSIHASTQFFEHYPSTLSAVNAVRKGLGLQSFGIPRGGSVGLFRDPYAPAGTLLHHDTNHSQAPLASIITKGIVAETSAIAKAYIHAHLGQTIAPVAESLGHPDISKLSLTEANRLATQAPQLGKLLAEAGPAAAHAWFIGRAVGMRTFDDDSIGRFKQTLKARGLTDGAWKTLCKIPATLSYNFACSCELAHWRKEEREPARLERCVEALCHVLALCARSGCAPEQTFALARSLFPADASKFSDDWRSREAAMPAVKARAAQSAMELLSPAFEMDKIRSPAEARAYLAEDEARSARQSVLARDLAIRAADALGHPDKESKFEGELNRAVDFLLESEMGVWQSLPEKLTFAILLRRADDWHREIEEEARAKADEANAKAEAARLRQEAKLGRALTPDEMDKLASKGPGWLSLVSKSVDDDLSAVSLNTQSLLREEGAAMRHCVSSYASRCREGASRIFSIRRNGDRVATLELARAGGGSGDSGVWSPVQLRGNCNAAVVDPAVVDFAAAVAAEYQAAHEARVQAILAKSLATKAANAAGEEPAPADAGEPAAKKLRAKKPKA